MICLSERLAIFFNTPFRIPIKDGLAAQYMYEVYYPMQPLQITEIDKLSSQVWSFCHGKLKNPKSIGNLSKLFSQGFVVLTVVKKPYLVSPLSLLRASCIASSTGSVSGASSGCSS